MAAVGRRPRGAVVAIGVVWAATLVVGLAFWVAVGAGLTALVVTGAMAATCAAVALVAAAVTVVALAVIIIVGSVAVHLDRRRAWVPRPRVPAPA